MRNDHLADVFLQRPVAGSVAVWIGIDVVGLDEIALLVDPGVVIGAGIFSDQSGVGVEAFLQVEGVITPIIGGAAAGVHDLCSPLHGPVRAALQGSPKISMLSLAHLLSLIERYVLTG